jgi:hypothetical protein
LHLSDEPPQQTAVAAKGSFCGDKGSLAENGWTKEPPPHMLIA